LSFDELGHRPQDIGHRSSAIERAGVYSIDPDFSHKNQPLSSNHYDFDPDDKLMTI